MQQLTDALRAHLDGELTTLATCWRLTRRDGVTITITDHDQPLTVAGVHYETASAASPSALSAQLGLSVDNLEFDGILSHDAIDAEDILAGRYDHAAIDVFLVNYIDPDQGTLPLKSGWLGEVTLRGGQFVAELRGLSSALQQTIGDLYTATCRATFGDARCGIDLAARTVNGSVTAIEAAHAFFDSARTEAGGTFAYGVLTFLSGQNAGLRGEIRDYSAGRFALFLPMPNPIAIGDTYQASAGCDKQFSTCARRYANAINFRGEPHVPGTDQMLETASTRSG